jgi:ribosomal protein S6
MGDELYIRDRRWHREPLKLTIRFKSPEVNNNGDTPVVDHIDLIAGKITGMVDPESPDYTKATNETTKVIATFTAKDWKMDRNGYKVIKYQIKDLDDDMYFRLRGTNLAVNTLYETDAKGNPLSDFEATDNLGLDGAEEAWADLWFYSNPIFVYVQ